MTIITNPLYPSVIAPLDGLISDIPKIELSSDIVLRNLESSELSRLNQILSGEDRIGFGLGELPPNIVCMETKLPRRIPADQGDDDWPQHWEHVRNVGGSLIADAISLLRLAQEGPIGSRLAIAAMVILLLFSLTEWIQSL